MSISSLYVNAQTSFHFLYVQCKFLSLLHFNLVGLQFPEKNFFIGSSGWVTCKILLDACDITVIVLFYVSLSYQKDLWGAWITISELRHSVTVKRMKLLLLKQRLKLTSILKGQVSLSFSLFAFGSFKFSCVINFGQQSSANVDNGCHSYLGNRNFRFLPRK